ncbi:MAG: 5'/3'-nucleotidase SurE [Proteobacteria bacterium]|nr:5'/3'-nucleotidase SurE [Pseudomonadota bacterium]
MKILVSNDDGVNAEGIAILARTLKSIAEVTVVAPDRDCSAASNSLTLSRPLRVTKLDNGFHSVNGTPTDSVHLALTGLFQELPDMVVSGINSGGNLGDDVIYSGTVAAAMEGRDLGYPAIAISLVGERPKHYETAAMVTKNIVLRLLQEPLPANTILNVNVPDLPISELKGFEICRLGKRHGARPPVKNVDPKGDPVYWIGQVGREQQAGPGTDFYAIKMNKVAITPIQIDLTDYQLLKPMSDWVDGFEVIE